MKFSVYNILIEREDSLIIFNSKNNKYVVIDSEPEYSKFLELKNSEILDPNDNMVNLLYQEGYIVDFNVDEFEQAQQAIKKYYAEKAKTLQFMIYTTEQCNFRCIYCPEEHISKSMSETTWNALYKYIEKGLSENLYKEIRLSFFGGEPLLESKNILRFLHKLEPLTEKYPGVKFWHDITTNGYLLTPKLYEELVKLNIKNFQITVDGFAETHDKMRPRVDGKGTWSKIIENLKYINDINDDTIITLRTNYNHINEDNMKDFYNWLDNNFENKKFKYLFHPVSKFNNNVDDNLIGEQQGEIQDKINEKLAREKKDITYNPQNLMSPLCLACKCAAPSYFTLTVNGKITKCEQIYGDKDAIGYLEDDGVIVYTNSSNKWLNNTISENCKRCQIYPLCGARACPEKDPSQYCDKLRNNYADMVITQIQKGNIL